MPIFINSTQKICKNNSIIPSQLQFNFQKHFRSCQVKLQSTEK
jgi:hypothetical protein